MQKGTETSELRGMAIEELEEKLVDLRNDLSKEKAVIASGTRAEKPAKIRNLRRTIGRIMTIINEKKKKENEVKKKE